MRATRVRIFYPADPVGNVPGGVDTFIRGIIKFAPKDVQFSLVGMTTDPESRPTGKWTRCKLGKGEFDFFPAVRVKEPGQRSRIPLSLRYMMAVAAAGTPLRTGFEVFEFHRIEPVMLFRRDSRPKNAFFHTDMSVIRGSSTDILWRYMPALYDAIEDWSIPKLSSLWSVRADAVEDMQLRYPRQSEAINFIPTWVDTQVFHPLSVDARAVERLNLAAAYGLDAAETWIASVGRLDHSKNPILLVEAFAQLVAENQSISLLLIGDGDLRRSIEQRIRSAGIEHRVRLLGVRGAEEISHILAAADVFALSSAYEGMPMALLEALGCGLPVATTDVGEVRRVVKPGLNGAIAVDHSVQGFVSCLRDVLVNNRKYGGEHAVQAIQPFRPTDVLERVYENYRELGARHRMGTGMAAPTSR